jgi:hypothetical protein
MDRDRFPDLHLQQRRIGLAGDAKERELNAESNAQDHRWRAFALLAVAYFMTIVDLTIVNVALPTNGELDFSPSGTRRSGSGAGSAPRGRRSD